MAAYCTLSSIFIRVFESIVIHGDNGVLVFGFIASEYVGAK
jgi:hypothetical protein